MLETVAVVLLVLNIVMLLAFGYTMNKCGELNSDTLDVLTTMNEHNGGIIKHYEELSEDYRELLALCKELVESNTPQATSGDKA